MDIAKVYEPRSIAPETATKPVVMSFKYMELNIDAGKRNLLMDGLWPHSPRDLLDCAMQQLPLDDSLRTDNRVAEMQETLEERHSRHPPEDGRQNLQTPSTVEIQRTPSLQRFPLLQKVPLLLHERTKSLLHLFLAQTSDI